MPRCRDARAAALDRVDAATSAYQPVREAIDRRLAEQAAADAEAARRAQEQRARRQREAEARFQAWQRRQAVADRPMPGGLTPREMATRGDDPAEWPPEVAATVGDIANTRIKECDRLDACATNLRAMGAQVETGPDWIEIQPATLHPAQIRCFGDHRIAMAFSIAGLRTPGVTLDDPGCVKKTLPTFYRSLGDAVRSFTSR